MQEPQEQYIVDPKGKKVGVILPVERYNRLLQGLHYLAIVTERRNQKPISFEEMKRRLKKDGIL